MARARPEPTQQTDLCVTEGFACQLYRPQPIGCHPGTVGIDRAERIPLPPKAGTSAGNASSPDGSAVSPWRVSALPAALVQLKTARRAVFLEVLDV